jgi:hypothetical protein
LIAGSSKWSVMSIILSRPLRPEGMRLAGGVVRDSRSVDVASGFAERILEHSQGIGVSKTL